MGFRGLRVQGLGFTDWCSGSRVFGLEVTVQGLGALGLTDLALLVDNVL